MFANKVHKDALAGSGESCEVFWYAVNNNKQVWIWGGIKWGQEEVKSVVHFFVFLMSLLFP